MMNDPWLCEGVAGRPPISAATHTANNPHDTCRIPSPHSLPCNTIRPQAGASWTRGCVPTHSSQPQLWNSK